MNVRLVIVLGLIFIASAFASYRYNPVRFRKYFNAKGIIITIVATMIVLSLIVYILLKLR